MQAILSVALPIAMLIFSAPTIDLSQAQSVRVTNVEDVEERRDILKRIKGGFDSVGSKARIISCPLIVDYVEQLPSGRNTSFGAVCHVKAAAKDFDLTVCDSRLQGGFTMTLGSVRREGLVEFVAANCRPGD